MTNQNVLLGTIASVVIASIIAVVIARDSTITVTILGICAPTITALIAALKAADAVEASKRNTEKLEDVKEHLNGGVQKIIDANAQIQHALGVKAGKEEAEREQNVKNLGGELGPKSYG